VIGAGRMGADHVRRISEVTSGAHVAAVVDVDIDRAKTVAADVDGCAAYGDVAEAMASLDVDAVLLASPGVAAELGLDHVEFATGAWSTAPHIDIDRLLDSDGARRELLAKLADRGLTISALTCSGNPPGGWRLR
jgi:predicted homoserine dehydrogenase-like protein